MEMLKALWAYRAFVLGSVKREFQSRYRNSILGAAWTIIQPLAMILVYTLIFSQVMRAKLPGIDSSFGYSIYLCSGVLTWELFAKIVGRGQGVFLEFSNLLKKVSFPRISLPLIVVLSACLDFLIIFGLFTGFLVISGNFPGWPFFAMIPLLCVQVLFSIGFAMIVGVLNVFFRDVGQFVGVLLQFWFWLTPIVYPVGIIPERFHRFMELNPLFGLMSAYQGIMVHGAWPDWKNIGIVAIISIFLCIFGLRLFRKRSGEMVDEL